MQVIGPATPAASRNIALAGALAEVVRSLRALLPRLPASAAAALECAFPMFTFGMPDGLTDVARNTAADIAAPAQRRHCREGHWKVKIHGVTLWAS